MGSGGFLFFNGGESCKFNFTIEDSNFNIGKQAYTDASAYSTVKLGTDGGGLFMIQASQLSLTVTNTTFYSIKSANYGGVFLLLI